MNLVHLLLAGKGRLPEAAFGSEAGIVNEQAERRFVGKTICERVYICGVGKISNADLDARLMGGSKFNGELFEFIPAASNQEKIIVGREFSCKGGANAARGAGNNSE
jgi:hypothetical protein